MKPVQLYGTPPTIPKQYSLETIQLYGTALEAFLFNGDPQKHLAALKELFKSVHCDLTGELRLPHNVLSLRNER